MNKFSTNDKVEFHFDGRKVEQIMTVIKQNGVLVQVFDPNGRIWSMHENDLRKAE